VLASYCGVGNPFSLSPVTKGEAALDIGCGAGVNTFVAAVMVGPEGRVIGIDLISEMLNRARTNLEKTSFKNVTFQEGSAEELPFPNRIFDVVISNGMFNLITDKAKALKEVFGVMKSSGRFLLADQILTGDMPVDSKSMLENWAR
jgi:ubiquinone/menaquinone biosynthesis C-methylase UbiE